jgi:hypothetical protein
MDECILSTKSRESCNEGQIIVEKRRMEFEHRGQEAWRFIITGGGLMSGKEWTFFEGSLLSRFTKLV